MTAAESAAGNCATVGWITPLRWVSSKSRPWQIRPFRYPPRSSALLPHGITRRSGPTPDSALADSPSPFPIPSKGDQPAVRVHPPLHLDDDESHAPLNLATVLTGASVAPAAGWSHVGSWFRASGICPLAQVFTTAIEPTAGRFTRMRMLLLPLSAGSMKKTRPNALPWVLRPAPIGTQSNEPRALGKPRNPLSGQVSIRSGQSGVFPPATEGPLGASFWGQRRNRPGAPPRVSRRKPGPRNPGRQPGVTREN